MTIKIINASQADHSKLIADFQVAMALETENFKLDLNTVSKGVTKIFENPSRGGYFIFKSGDVVTGCALTLFEWSDWRNGDVIWIHSVYVLPEFRQKSIFKTFYLHLKEKVQSSSNLKGLRLYVDKTNIRAIDVYQKIGMDSSHYQLFEWLK
jgi:ribosomal protein S18 acetylase RimI-like enzyme